MEFYNREGRVVEIVITANKRTDGSGSINGCFCFVQVVTADVQRSDVQQAQPRPSSLQTTHVSVQDPIITQQGQEEEHGQASSGASSASSFFFYLTKLKIKNK